LCLSLDVYALERVIVDFARPYTDDLVDGGDEDLAVADLSGSGAVGDGFDNGVRSADTGARIGRSNNAGTSVVRDTAVPGRGRVADLCAAVASQRVAKLDR